MKRWRDGARRGLPARSILRLPAPVWQNSVRASGTVAADTPPPSASSSVRVGACDPTGT